jgi:excisionase family DNA binding protein
MTRFACNPCFRCLGDPLSNKHTRHDEAQQNTIQCSAMSELLAKEAARTMTLDSTAITPRVLKTKQAARYLAISTWKLRNLVQVGEIPCILGSGTSPWLFDLRDLDNWIERLKRTL